MPLTQHLVPLLKPAMPYLAHVPTPLLSLPFTLTVALSSPKPWSAFWTAPTTHPLHAPLALTLAIIPLIYTLGLISGNVSWVDRIWTTYPVTCSALVVAWALVNPAGAVYAHNLPRLALMLVLQVVWSIRLSGHTAKRGLYNLLSEDYRYTQFRKLVGPLVFQVIHLFVVAIAQPLLIFSLCLPVYALLVIPPRELPGSPFAVQLSTISPLLPASAAGHAPGSTPVLTLADGLLFLVGLGIIYVEACADNQMYAYQESKHALDGKDVPLVRPPKGAGRNSSGLPQPTAYPVSHHPGFPTKGLFKYSRHPNFAAEQLFWLCQALFVANAESSGVTRAQWIGPTVFGPALALSLLFCASTALTEWITGRKFPEYAAYKQLVGQFLPQETAYKWLWTTLAGSRARLQARLSRPS